MRKQEQKGKITALYERLSHDDGRSDESVSVENQKRILEDYARKNGFTNVRHFTDDGVRGTTFKRPGLDAMVDEIRAGNVATVIVKDQSRIGRDVVEVGLLKRTFDEYNVRFIAANDNLDTANGFDIMSIFRDVINEWYVADTSRKIKTVFKSRMEKGLRCSGAVPYGYLASKEEKGEWVIDEEAAAVVRRIFQMVMDGQSVNGIARTLRAEQIPIPSEHWKRIGCPVRANSYRDPPATDVPAQTPRRACQRSPVAWPRTCARPSVSPPWAVPAPHAGFPVPPSTVPSVRSGSGCAPCSSVRPLRNIYKVKLGKTFPKLDNYQVTIPPGGRTDALVQTVITWREGDRIWRTRGLDADQTEAAIKATLKMINMYEADKSDDQAVSPRNLDME